MQPVLGRLLLCIVDFLQDKPYILHYACQFLLKQMNFLDGFWGQNQTMCLKLI